jgi:hypothetical protein
MGMLAAHTKDWRHPRRHQVIDPQKRYQERKQLEEKLKAQTLSGRSVN